MKKNHYLLIIILFSFLSFSQNVSAAVWVEQISGNPAAILIVRQGNFITAEEVMRLQPGDIIKIQDDKSTVRLMMGNGGLKTINRAQSPFTVAGGKTEGSFLANLMGEVKKMLVASADETEAVAMMTRGRSKALEILSVGSQDNLVLTGTQRLGVSWKGGKAPYRLSLLFDDEDKPLLLKEQLAGNSFTVIAGKNAGQGLASGEYQLLLEGMGGKSSASKEIEILVVEADELPEKARKLLALKLNKRLEARLLINILHKHESWRFYAHSLAVEHKLDKERRLLVQMK